MIQVSEGYVQLDEVGKAAEENIKRDIWGFNEAQFEISQVAPDRFAR